MMMRQSERINRVMASGSPAKDMAYPESLTFYYFAPSCIQHRVIVRAKEWPSGHMPTWGTLDRTALYTAPSHVGAWNSGYVYSTESLCHTYRRWSLFWRLSDLVLYTTFMPE
jgi:hypothetical protein